MMTKYWKKFIYGVSLVVCMGGIFFFTSITSQASSKTTVEITLNSGTTPRTDFSESRDSSSDSSHEDPTSSTSTSSTRKVQARKTQQLLKTNDSFSWLLLGIGMILLLFVLYCWRRKEE